ncbi:hypothetical protein ACFL59_10060, partial [Planctomycetota bacterium]
SVAANGAPLLPRNEPRPNLPVVLVTGHPKSELIEQAMLHAPIMLLSKPVEAELLERTVRALVGHKLARTA